MGRTIIQPIGPLYGEAVNGTVFGRPNGSIYVPSTNWIRIMNPTSYIKNFVVNGAYRVRFVDGDGLAIDTNIVAAAQDVNSYIRLVIATDSGLSTIVATLNRTAGQFNIVLYNLANDYQLDADDTYYVAAQLINNGEVIATSDVEEVTVSV